MMLYRFIKLKHGLESLRARQVKVSRIKDLNDPFEFLALEARDPDRRKALEALRHYFHLVQGILCFSESWHDPVMWSHYADAHRGICLGFDVAGSGAVAKVKYVKRRLPWPNDLDQDFTTRLSATKFEHWSYEAEHRMFVSLDQCRVVGSRRFMPFSENLVAREVIVGMRSPARRQEIVDALGGLRGIQLYKTRVSTREFRVTRNRWAAPLTRGAGRTSVGSVAP